MKAYSKTLFRMLRQHLGRFLAVTAIITLGIGFMTGLGSVKPKLCLLYTSDAADEL